MKILNGKYSCPREAVVKSKVMSKAIVEDQQGRPCQARWFPCDAADQAPLRATMDRLRALKHMRHEALPTILDFGHDAALNAFVVVTSGDEDAFTLSEHVDELSPNMLFAGLHVVVGTLADVLAKQRIAHGSLSPDQIVVDGEGRFRIVGLGLHEFLGNVPVPEQYRAAVDGPESAGQKPSFRADVYAFGRILEWVADRKGIVWPPQVTKLIERMVEQDEDERPTWPVVKECLAAVELVEESEVVAVAFKHGHDERVLEDLVKAAPRVRVGSCEPNIILDMIIGDRLHEGVLWLKDERKLLFNGSRERDQRYEHTFTRLPGRHRFAAANGGQRFDLGPVLSQLGALRAEERTFQRKQKNIAKRLEFFKELIDKELAVIEESAFRVEYTEWRENDGVIEFRLKRGEGFDENRVKEHIRVWNDRNAEEFPYIVSLSSKQATTRGKAELKGSGRPFDLELEQGWLRIKDHDFGDPERLPERGWLLEDTSKRRVEKERQKKALISAERGEALNPDLIHALFDPASLPVEPGGNERPGVYDLQKDAGGAPIPYNPNQQDAIHKALHREPISLIQGPPGTGKTTVITEVVLQLLARDPGAKILITSQTNNAVDQVLENLAKSGIPVLRLKASSASLSPEMRKHVLKGKVGGWKKAVKEEARKRFERTVREGLAERANGKQVPLSVLEQAFLEKDLDKVKRALERVAALLKGTSIPRQLPNERGALIMALGTAFGLDLTELVQLCTLHWQWIGVVNALSEDGQVMQRIVDSVRVIGSTCNHVASGQYAKLDLRFDHVIMDESGKATLAEALVPIVMGRKLILVGDHRQLKPMLTAERKVEEWLRNRHKEEARDMEWEDYFNRPSLFEETIKDLPYAYRTQLTECRRSSKDQIERTSQCFYEPEGDDPLVAAPRKADKEHGLHLKENTSIVFVDIGRGAKHTGAGGSPSLINPESAKAVLSVLARLDRYEKVRDYSVGVITAYGAQWQLLDKELRNRHRHALRNIRQWGKHRPEEKFPVSVIDRFQGNECDIVILDLVRGGPNCGLGFLEVPNRINVALSRQKRLLVIVGDYQGLLAAKTKRLKGQQAAIQKYLGTLKPEWIIDTNTINTFFA